MNAPETGADRFKRIDLDAFVGTSGI